VASRIHSDVVKALPEVPPGKRREIAEAGPAAADHARLESELGVFACVEHAPSPARRSQPRELRVVAWNLERGRFLGPAAGLLSRLAPDVVLLSEMDVGMARSGQHHTTRELATTLGHGYAYAVEFVELDLGGAEERERCAGQENRHGLHGGAITSAHPLARPAVVRLDAGGQWLDGSRDEARVGGRIAVLATVRAGGSDVVLASVHLESHSDPEHRAEQMGALLEAIDAYAPGAPALVGGDLNTMSMPTGHLGEPERLKEALEADPERLLRPVRYEPLFERARAAGFEWRICNVEGEGTHRRGPGGATRRTPVRLDWFLSRGLGCSGAEVVDAVDLATGDALSDHEALVVTVRPPARPLPSRRPTDSGPGRPTDSGRSG
jgi:endonuclease/exonuclease/phosphatase family metal-dependent hydrolase